MPRFTGKQLNERLGIINAWEYLKVASECGVEIAVMVDFTSEQRGRGYRPARWQVIRPGYKTAPETHWTNNGNKTFNVFGRENKEPQRLAAIAWAAERYGYPADRWVKITTTARQTVWVPKIIAEVVTDAYVAGRPRIR